MNYSFIDKMISLRYEFRESVNIPAHRLKEYYFYNRETKVRVRVYFPEAGSSRENEGFVIDEICSDEPVSVWTPKMRAKVIKEFADIGLAFMEDASISHVAGNGDGYEVERVSDYIEEEKEIEKE